MPDWRRSSPSSLLRASLAAFCCGIAAGGFFGATAAICIGVACAAPVVVFFIAYRPLIPAFFVGVLRAGVSAASSAAAAHPSSASALELHFTRIFPDPEAQLASAFLLGGPAPADLARDFRNAGIAHVLAASGYNVVMLSTVAMTAFAVLGLRRQRAAAAVILLLAAFVSAAGGQASVVRAAVMGSLSLVAVAIGRRYEPAAALLLAAAVMLAADPSLAVRDVGFQLSFAAVWGLHALAPAFMERLRCIPQRFDLRRSVAETLAATAATMPVALAAFGTVPAFGLIANLLVLPAVPLATGLSLVALAVSPASLAIAAVPAAAATAVFRYIEAVAAFFGRTAALVIRVPPGPTLGAVAAAWILLLWYALARAPAKRLVKPSAGDIIIET